MSELGGKLARPMRFDEDNEEHVRNLAKALHLNVRLEHTGTWSIVDRGGGMLAKGDQSAMFTWRDISRALLGLAAYGWLSP